MWARLARVGSDILGRSWKGAKCIVTVKRSEANGVISATYECERRKYARI